jgi:hypothetical protein
VQHFSEAERQRRAQAFLSTVTVVLREAPRSDPSPGELDASSLAVLVTAALQPGVFLTDLYESLGLHPAEGRKAVSDLQARGYGRVHRLARGGRGGQPAVVEVLKAGVAVLRERGVTPAPLLIPRGGLVHSVYGTWVQQACVGRGSRVRTEHTLGAKCFDLVEETREGVLVGYEICCSGDAACNADALLRGAAVAGLERVVGVFASKALMQGVARTLRGNAAAVKVRVAYAGAFCPLQEGDAERAEDA